MLNTNPLGFNMNPMNGQEQYRWRQEKIERGTRPSRTQRMVWLIFLAVILIAVGLIILF